MNHDSVEKKRVQTSQRQHLSDAVVCILILLMVTIGCTSKEPEQKNLLKNPGFEVWSNATVFDSPKNTKNTVDGWMPYSDGEPTFTISREEKLENVKSGKYLAKIEISQSNNSKVLDFYQPIQNRDLYKGKKLKFSAQVRCNKVGVVQVIVNDDGGTAGSRFNKGTDWETLSGIKIVGTDNITYLNFAIRIRTDIQSIIYVDDCMVAVD